MTRKDNVNCPATTATDLKFLLSKTIKPRRILLAVLSCFISLNSTAQFEWGFKLGDTDMLESTSMVTDASGNLYLAGSYEDTVDFDPGPGIYPTYPVSGGDHYVAKFDPAGNFLWVISSAISIVSIDVDDSENLYVTGVFGYPQDLDPGPGVDPDTAMDGMAIYISKFDPTGAYLWSKTIDNQSGTEERTKAVAVDASGDIIVTGYYTSTTDFDPGPGVSLATSNGMQDIFVLKLDNNGDFLWVRTMGSPDDDYGLSISIDDSLNIIVAGKFLDTMDFNFGPGSTILNGDWSKFFLLKMNENGDFKWAISPTGYISSRNQFIDVDDSGNVYVATSGHSWYDYDPGPGVYNLPISSSYSMPVTQKFSPMGDLIFAISSGNPSADVASFSIAVDPYQGIITCGYIFGDSIDMDPGITTHYIYTDDQLSTYFCRHDLNGNFIDAGSLSGNNNKGRLVATDNFGSTFISGLFGVSVDLDPGAGSYIVPGVSGIMQTYVLKLGYALSTHDLYTEMNVSIYPNPTSDNISIVSDTKIQRDIIVYDVNGKIILATPSFTSKTNLDVSTFSGGVYFCKVIFDDGSTSMSRFIVK